VVDLGIKLEHSVLANTKFAAPLQNNDAECVIVRFPPVPFISEYLAPTVNPDNVVNGLVPVIVIIFAFMPESERLFETRATLATSLTSKDAELVTKELP
jgi:hypothetical protein